MALVLPYKPRNTHLGGDSLYGGPGSDTLRARDGVKGNDFASGGIGKDTILADPRDLTRD